MAPACYATYKFRLNHRLQLRSHVLAQAYFSVLAGLLSVFAHVIEAKNVTTPAPEAGQEGKLCSFDEFRYISLATLPLHAKQLAKQLDFEFIGDLSIKISNATLFLLLTGFEFD